MKLLQTALALLFLLTTAHAQGSPDLFISSLHMPCYPPLARQAKLEGETRIAIQLDKGGNVVSAEPTDGSSIFQKAAIDNVRTWVFAGGPGANIEGLKTTVTFNYKLEGEPGFDRCATRVLFNAFNQVEIVTQPGYQLVTPAPGETETR